MRWYLFLLFLTLLIFEIILSNVKFNKSYKIEPFRKYDAIKDQRYNKVKHFINNNFYPSFSVNHGIQKTTYYLNLIKKYNFLPIGSFPEKKTYLCDEGYGFINYKTDHFGLRNSENDWNKKFPYDTIIIGDSFAIGACVKDGNDIAGLLRKKGRQVINLGLIDNQPIQYFYLINQFTKPQPPKNIVLIFYQGNDFRYSKYREIYLKYNKSNSVVFSKKKNMHTLHVKGENFYNELETFFKIDADNYLRNKKNVETNLKNNIKNILKLAKLRNILETKYGLIIKKKMICYLDKCIYGSIDELFSDAKLAIFSLLENCNPKNNCNPVIVVIPSSDIWHLKKFNNVVKTHFDKIIDELISKNHYLRYFDASKVINDKDLSYYAPAGGHLSNKGYKILSQNLENFLK